MHKLKTLMLMGRLMAIVDDIPGGGGSGRGKMPELKSIDINDSSIPEGKVEKINPDADAWARSTPPPDGTYRVKLFKAKEGFQIGKTEESKKGANDGDDYFVCNLELKIQMLNEAGEVIDKDLHDRTIFGKVSTYISAGKEISTMAGLVKKMGLKLPEQISHKQLCQLFMRCLAKEPSLYVEGEWKAWDMEKGAWLCVGMNKFPKDEGGSPIAVVRNGKGEQVNANWKINKWFGIKEYKTMKEEEAKRRAGRPQQNSGQALNGREVVGTAQGGGFSEVSGVGVGAGAKVPDDDFILDE